MTLPHTSHAGVVRRLESSLCIVLGLLMASTAVAQSYKTDIPPSIVTPDTLETRLGTLRFTDGFPDEATVQKVYDNLDFQRGVQAFLTTIPTASQAAMRRAIRTLGPDNGTVFIAETLLDSRSLFLTGNSENVYASGWIDLKNGPVVIESPPNTLGVVDDFWYRYVTDLGNAGPDKGQGGKYLLLPPDYEGDVPQGYHVFKSRTFNNWFVSRGFLVNGDTKPAVENFKTRVAHLSPGAGRQSAGDNLRQPLRQNHQHHPLDGLLVLRRG